MLRFKFLIVFFIFYNFCICQPNEDTWQETEGWFTLHHDVMRSGRTSYSPEGPFKYQWHNKYFDELISTEVEPIVAESNIYFGTWQGNFYALKLSDGAVSWQINVKGGVRHSPCYYKGSIYIAGTGDQKGGDVICVNAADGKEKWKFTSGIRGGFATSPALYKDKVYIGSRYGTLYCLDAKTGKKIWSYANPEKAPYLQSCAARDDKVIVSAEDMIPRAFDAASGKILWEAARMESDSVRFYYPVFWDQTVIFRTSAPDHELNRIQGIVRDATEEGKKWQEVMDAHPWKKEFWDYENSVYTNYTPEKHKKEQEYIRQKIDDGTLIKTFYCLSVKDGKEHISTSVTYSASENGYSTPTAPPVGFDGELYVLYKSIYSMFTYPIRQYDALGTLNYKTGLTEYLERVPPGRKSMISITADEINNFIVAGNKLIDCHDHNLVYYEIDTKKVKAGFAPKSRKETWGGILGTGSNKKEARPQVPKDPLFKGETEYATLLTVNEWNGTAGGAVAVYKNYVIWRTGNMIICLQGSIK